MKKCKHTLEMLGEMEMSLHRSIDAVGNIEVTNVDTKGEFVKVRNKGTTKVTMSRLV